MCNGHFLLCELVRKFDFKRVIFFLIYKNDFTVLKSLMFACRQLNLPLRGCYSVRKSKVLCLHKALELPTTFFILFFLLLKAPTDKTSSQWHLFLKRYFLDVLYLSYDLKESIDPI